MDPIPFAVAAGMLAAVNPCGFAMLPAYLSLFALGPSSSGPDGRTEQRQGPAAAVGRALAATGAMTVGFLLVFGTFGLLLTPIASSVQRWLPIVTVGIGLLLVVMGLLLLGGRSVSLPVRFPTLTDDPAASPLAMTLYGMAYAIASLGCTIGPFLVVTTTTFTAGDLTSGIAAYGAYALGMGLVVGVLAVAAALASDAAAHAVRRSRAWLGRATGALLVVVGAYVGWYGAYELRVYAGGSAEDAVVDTAGRVQSRVATWVDATDPIDWALVLLVLAVGATLVAVARRRRFGRRLS